MSTKQLLANLETVQFLSKKQAIELAKSAKKEFNNVDLNNEIDAQLFNITHANGSATSIFNIVDRFVNN